jgi:isoleucyl-tRNA synthetase
VKAKQVSTSENTLDRYILAKAKAAVLQAQASMDAYDTPGATDAITGFFDVLNNWYIRRSRERFWAEEVTADKQAAYDTLYTVLNLLVTAAAPLLPFTAEMVYRGLNGEAKSVHLADFPNVDAIDRALELIADMDRVRDACTAMGSIRSAENIRNRQPLASATLYGAGADRLKPFSELMQDELNVKDIRFSNTLEGVAEYTLTVDFKVAGKRLGPKMKAVGAAAKSGDWRRDGDQVVVGDEAMQSGEYNLQLKPLLARGAQPLPGNDALVVLDLAITPELEAEGRARDLVRMIQQARKDAGLHVADRITLALDIPADFSAALATHKDYIAEQVLAVSIGEGAAQSEKQLTQELDGAQFTIGITKAT